VLKIEWSATVLISKYIILKLRQKFHLKTSGYDPVVGRGVSSFASLVVFVSSVLACHLPIAPPPGAVHPSGDGPRQVGPHGGGQPAQAGDAPPRGSAYPRPAHVVVSVRFPKGCTGPTSFYLLCSKVCEVRPPPSLVGG